MATNPSEALLKQIFNQFLEDINTKINMGISQRSGFQDMYRYLFVASTGDRIKNLLDIPINMCHILLISKNNHCFGLKGLDLLAKTIGNTNVEN